MIYPHIQSFSAKYCTRAVAITDHGPSSAAENLPTAYIVSDIYFHLVI
jgi:hypothetical protein